MGSKLDEPTVMHSVTSNGQDVRIDIVKRDDNNFELHIFISTYDSEEDFEYTARRFPNPGGVYGDSESAFAEAKSMIAVYDRDGLLGF